MLELPRGRISGAALSALVAAVRRTPAKHAVAHVLRAELGIAGLGDASVPRRPVPQSNAPLAARTNHERESQSLPLPAAGDWPRSSAALLAAYRAGSASPPAVVEAALAGARFLAAQVPSRGPLLDFDDALTGPAVQDIWLLVPDQDEHGQQQRRLFIDAYQTFRDFEPSWLKLVEPLRALRYIHYAAWIAKRWKDPAFPAAFPHFNTEEYWNRETRDLEEQLARAEEIALRGY